MTYRQITSEQRYMLAALRMQGFANTQIAQALGCHRSTIEKTGLVIIGKLPSRTTASVNARAITLIQASSSAFRTITADNGTEFHNYAEIEDRTQAIFYFASPYHSWERGTNENTNGLIRQYLPKGTSMTALTQAACNEIARQLNTRPRKRHGYKTPLECLHEN